MEFQIKYCLDAYALRILSQGDMRLDGRISFSYQGSESLVNGQNVLYSRIYYDIKIIFIGKRLRIQKDLCVL